MTKYIEYISDIQQRGIRINYVHKDIKLLTLSSEKLQKHVCQY